MQLYFQVILLHLAVPGLRFPTRQLLIIIANYLTINRSWLEYFVKKLLFVAGLGERTQQIRIINMAG
jgi:hypothetical protein